MSTWMRGGPVFVDFPTGSPDGGVMLELGKIESVERRNKGEDVLVTMTSGKQYGLAMSPHEFIDRLKQVAR